MRGRWDSDEEWQKYGPWGAALVPNSCLLKNPHSCGLCGPRTKQTSSHLHFAKVGRDSDAFSSKAADLGFVHQQLCSTSLGAPRVVAWENHLLPQQNKLMQRRCRCQHPSGPPPPQPRGTSGHAVIPAFGVTTQKA